MFLIVFLRNWMTSHHPQEGVRDRRKTAALLGGSQGADELPNHLGDRLSALSRLNLRLPDESRPDGGFTSLFP